MESLSIGSVKDISKGELNLEMLANAKKFYAENHYIILENFLDLALVQHLNDLIVQAKPEIFCEADEGEEHIKGHIFTKAKELQLFPNILMNQERVVSVLADITTDERLKGVACYAYRSQETDKHALRWHQDLIDQKLFVLSANLSMNKYEGGEFALRIKSSQKELVRLTNSKPGRLILGRIGEDFEHETTKVIGPNPRITLAGWGVGYKWRENTNLVD